MHLLRSNLGVPAKGPIALICSSLHFFKAEIWITFRCPELQILKKMLNTDFQHYLFARTSKPLKSGKVPIYLRIQCKSNRSDISTGVSCLNKHWNNDFKRIKGELNDEELNTILEQWENKARQAIKALSDEEDYYTVEDVRDHIHGKRKVTSLLEFYNLRKDELTHDIDYSPNTLKVYQSTLKHLKAYLKKKYRRSDFPLNRIDYSFISSFFTYLKSNCGCNVNSANKYLKTLRAILNEARKQRLIKSSPFEHYQIKAGQYNRTYLTEDELQKIINAELKDPKLILVRDFFLFVCFTGLHYSDVKSLRTNHILTRNGRKWILKDRTKNGEEALLPLLKAAEDIVERHRSLPKMDNELLKMYSNQKTNQHLKDLAKECKVNANLTCRVGRHTFATTVTLTNQVPLESVSQMLGHTSVKTTQIYARVVNNKLLNDMREVDCKY